MRRSLIILSILSLGLLMYLSMYMPETTLMWLASESSNFQLARGILVLLLYVLLITNPPRKIILRLFTGMVSIGLFSWSTYAVYSYQMQVLDSLVFIGVSFVLGVTALELQKSEQPSTRPINNFYKNLYMYLILNNKQKIPTN